MQAGPLLSRLMLLGAALLFSTGGTAIKSCGLTDWQIASFRGGIAALVLLAVLPDARRGWTLKTFAVGAVYAATLTFYALANKSTTAANAIFLQSSAPLYILLLAPWLLGERSRLRDLLLVVVMAGGLALFFLGRQPTFATAPDPVMGNVYGAFSGFFWALTVLGLRSLASGSGSEDPEDSADSRRAAPVRAVVVGSLLAFVGTLPAALPVASATVADWGWVVYLGVFQVAGAYLLLTRGIEQVPAFEASLLLLVEPIFNPLWTWWRHGEIPTGGALLGGALILTAATVKTWLDMERRPAAARLETP